MLDLDFLYNIVLQTYSQSSHQTETVLKLSDRHYHTRHFLSEFI